MTMKLRFTLFLLLYPVFSFSQNLIVPEPDERLARIEELNARIDSVRADNDIASELILSLKLVEYRVKTFGEDANFYEDLVHVESLMKEHPGVTLPDSVFLQFYLRMGWALSGQGKPEEGLTYLNKGEEEAGKKNSKEFLRKFLVNKATTLAQLNRVMEGEGILNDLQKKAIEQNDSIFLHEVFEKKFSLYLRIGQLDSALIFAKKSLDDFSPSETKAYRYNSTAFIMLVLTPVSKTDSIIYYASEGLKFAEEAQADRTILSSHNILKTAYSIKGDYKKAYEHFEKFYNMEQKIYSFSSAIKIGDLNTEREKERSRLQEALAEERISGQRTIIWLVSLGLLILVIGLIYIFNQLRHIRNQNAIIEQEKLRAEHSERVKEQFLANMSHEIRTPMNAISGMISALKRREYSEEQGVYLDAMKKSSDNLLIILNDILDMSKLVYGNPEVARIPVNVVEVCQHVVSLLNQRASDNDLELYFKPPRNFPKLILGDPVRLNQILINLVGNAIKFTNRGSIEVILEQAETTYTIKVKDTGTGISEDALETIFEAFQQGDESLTKKYKGTGLGLAISKQLVELQSGSISVDSTEGEGSTFSITLPLESADNQQAVNNQLSEKELKEIASNLRGLSFLIVEDNPFNAMVIEDDLKWYIPQAKITVVENGKIGIQKFKEEDFDIVLMDVQMPELDGYATTTEIRKIEVEKGLGKKMPIIAMTASVLKDQIDKAFKAGMNDYIPKPYSHSELILTLRRSLTT